MKILISKFRKMRINVVMRPLGVFSLTTEKVPGRFGCWRNTGIRYLRFDQKRIELEQLTRGFVLKARKHVPQDKSLGL